jgi:hypothetical protein
MSLIRSCLVGPTGRAFPCSGLTASVESPQEEYLLSEVGLPPEGSSSPEIDRQLCQVVGLNQNFTSKAGTQYHIQVEDRGPVVDPVTESMVRRVNVIVYSNYGEPNARIIHGRDHDFPDVRNQAHNRFIEDRIKVLASEARAIITIKEERLVTRIKRLIREYYVSKDESKRREFAEVNALYPFLFSRAWRELKADKDRSARPPAPLPAEVAVEAEAHPEDVVYPLDAGLRERVLEIERIIVELEEDVRVLKAQGGADDILLQTCRKLAARARESLTGRDGSEFSERRLDMMRNSLRTTWRQVKSRLKSSS